MIKNDNQKLGYKESLSTLSSGLKKVLNPSIFSISSDQQPQDWIKINTNLEESCRIGIHVKGLAESTKVIQFDGYCNLNNGEYFYGNNHGSSSITHIAYKYVDGLYVIALKGNKISSLSAELFIYESESDNKNHATGITTFADGEETPEESIIWIKNTDPFVGESAANWSAAFDTGAQEDVIIDSSSHAQSTKIDTIKKAVSADKLKDNITISFTGDVTGSGTLNSGATSVNIETTLSESIIEEIESSLEIPLASTEAIGGIRLFDNSDSIPTDHYPLKLNEEKAYVDLGDINTKITSISSALSDVDIHRFEDLNNVPDEVKKPGMIVQYIGPKTSKYTKGWFYQYTPIAFTVSKNTNKWGFTDVQAGQSIAIHNATINYQINTGDLLLHAIFEESDTQVTDSTIFQIIQKGSVIEELPYSEILNIFKIHIEDAYLEREYYEDCTLNLIVGENDCVWVQKNVQPLFEAQSALIYRGYVEHYSELEAKTPDAQPGDVWTVRDRSDQEYFYKESESIDWQDHWEFMGQILDVSEYKGDHTEDQNVFADVSVTDIVGSKDKLISTHYNSREADNSTTVQVGGIAANTTAATLRGKTISEMLDMILFPDAEPTISGSESVSLSGQTVVKFGSVCPEEWKF